VVRSSPTYNKRARQYANPTNGSWWMVSSPTFIKLAHQYANPTKSWWIAQVQPTEIFESGDRSLPTEIL
jgi:hypothetical protein